MEIKRLSSNVQKRVLEKIIHTTGAKVIEAVFNFLTVWLCSYYLGSEIYGKIALLTLIVFFISLVNGLITGNSLLYYVSRFSMQKLVTIAFFWVTATTILSLIVLVIIIFLFKIEFELYSAKELLTIPALVFVNSITTVFRNSLLGRQYIAKANNLGVLLIFSRLILLVGFIVLLNQLTIWAFINAFVLSNIIAILFYVFAWSDIRKITWVIAMPEKSLFKSLLSYGFAMQASAALGILSQRISYILITIFLPVSSLGIFSLAVQITESIKIIGTSISDVLLTRLSNVKAKNKSVDLTIKSFRFTTYVTFFSAIIIIIIPSFVYTLIFGADFLYLKQILLSLLLGVFSYSGLLVLKQYFNGSGRPKINLLMSFVGIVIVSIIQIPLMQKFELVGVGMANSITFLLLLVFGVFLFLRDSNRSVNDLLPKKSDYIFSYEMLKSLILKN